MTSVYYCCKHVLPYMQEQGKGSIVNTASFVAVMGAATSQISYSASKGGVLSMSRELGVEFARQGIRVNALCPGPVNTPLLKELFAKGSSVQHADWCTPRWGVSLNRMNWPRLLLSQCQLIPRSLPPASSWSTVASRALTSLRSIPEQHSRHSSESFVRIQKSALLYAKFIASRICAKP